MSEPQADAPPQDGDCCPLVFRDAARRRTLAKGRWVDDRWLRANKFIITPTGEIVRDIVRVRAFHRTLWGRLRLLVGRFWRWVLPN